MLSKFFIHRPVFAAVLAILIVIGGIASIRNMPVAQYPKLTPPTISISAQYPGADATTVMTGVIEPMESQLAGLANVMYVASSTSNSGNGQITITLNIGADVDAAMTDIQNRLQRVEPLLPATTRQLGLSISQKSADMLMVAAFYSSTKDSIEISNFVSNTVLKHLKTVPGAGEARIFGQKDYAMRIWTDPLKLNQYKVTSQDIVKAVQEQNFQASVGRIGQEPVPAGQILTVSMKTDGRLKTVEDFQKIILKADSTGNVVHLSDVAKLELGTDNYEFYGRLNGQPAVLVGISADANANALDTAEAVKEKLELLSKSFPDGIQYKIPYDTTVFVKLSIEEVLKTLFEAILLVTLVVFVFLQSWRASLLPLAAIPVSIMGAFIGMYLFGYSINTLTLFGLILAIGIVVDDAIVVVENMERIIQEDHIDPKEAAIKAMEQITSPIIAIVLVLSAIFIPTIFVGGVTGEMYKQFAITIAVSVFFSGLVALILTPTMGSNLLVKNHKPFAGPIGRALVFFNEQFAKMTVRYTNFSMAMITHKKKSLAVYLLILVILGGLIYKMPVAFLPKEDTGVFMAVASLPEGATFERTYSVLEKIEPIIRAQDGVENVVAMVGMNVMSDAGGPTSITMFVRLKHWDERKDKSLQADSIMEAINKKIQHVNDAEIMLIQPPAIRGMGRSNGLQFRVIDTSNQNELMNESAGKMLEQIKGSKMFIMAMLNVRSASPSLTLTTDVEKAKLAGVSIADIYDEVQAAIAYKNINQFEKDGHSYWVKIQADGKYRTNKKVFDLIYVKNRSGDFIPVSEFVTISETTSPANIEHFNGMPSISVNSMIIPIFSSGTGMDFIEKIGESLPSGMNIAWEGMAYQQQLVGNSNLFVLTVAFMMVFLILAAQYGKWILPLAVILSIPFGMFGAYVAIALNMMPKDIYFQIGLLTLIGLSAKNAILVVEFAEDGRKSGLSVYEATKAACMIRYRPMMMTSIAFIFGVIPLVLSSGAGAESRFSIGIGVLGGMLAATFIERYFIPFIYYHIATFGEYLEKRKESK